MAGGSKMAASVLLTLLFAVPAGALTGCGEGNENRPESDAGASSAGGAAARIEHFGSEASDVEARRAEAALSDYLDARSAGDWAAACAHLAKSPRRLLARVAAKSERIDGQGCAAALAAFTKRLSPSERAALDPVEVESLRVEGAQGYIVYRGRDGARYATRATREGGSWSFSVFASRL